MKYKLYLCSVLLGLLVINTGCKTKAEKDAHTALKSAENGQAIAQFRLGKMYNTGEGVEEDKVYAYMWTNLAMLQGLGDTAEEYLNEISVNMTETQIAEAQQKSEVCKKNTYKNC